MGLAPSGQRRRRAGGCPRRGSGRAHGGAGFAPSSPSSDAPVWHLLITLRASVLLPAFATAVEKLFCRPGSAPWERGLSGSGSSIPTARGPPRSPNTSHPLGLWAGVLGTLSHPGGGTAVPDPWAWSRPGVMGCRIQQAWGDRSLPPADAPCSDPVQPKCPRHIPRSQLSPPAPPAPGKQSYGWAGARNRWWEMSSRYGVCWVRVGGWWGAGMGCPVSTGGFRGVWV